MFAYGGGSIKNIGIYDEIKECLVKAEKNIIEFPGIMSNPTYAKVMEGAKLAKENNIDFILAAGTGSEMNGGAVITNEARKVKTGRDYPKCNPGFALADPTYTYSVPERQMVSGGFDTLSHIMEIYFSKPDEDNVSDDMAEALMKNVIRSLRAAVVNPQDYTARSNLMRDAAMAENRILKLGKQTDFQCHQMEHQLAAYTNCNHGEGLAVLHPAYYRHIYKDGCAKFKRFAVNVWGISDIGKTEEETACEGVEALADFIRELGLPVTLRDLGVDGKTDLKRIADSCVLSAGSYKKMTHKEILDIFQECYENGRNQKWEKKEQASAKGR